MEVSVPDSTLSFFSVAWLSSSIVFAGGYRFEYGSVIRSTNKGVTWSSVLTGVDRIFDVSCATVSSIDYVVAVSDTGYLYSSVNGGASWRTDVSVSASLYGVYISATGLAFAAGALTFPVLPAVYSADLTTSVTSWTLSSPSSSSSQQLNDVCSFDGTNVVVVGNSGSVYFSSDSGSTWTSVSPGTTSDLSGLVCPSSTVLAAVGSAATIITSSNGGSSWSSVSSAALGLGGLSLSVDFLFHSVSALSTSQLYVAASNGAILYSSNFGSSWSLVSKLSSTAYSLGVYSDSLAVIGGEGLVTTAVSGTALCKYIVNLLVSILLYSL